MNKPSKPRAPLSNDSGSPSLVIMFAIMPIALMVAAGGAALGMTLGAFVPGTSIVSGLLWGAGIPIAGGLGFSAFVYLFNVLETPASYAAYYTKNAIWHVQNAWGKLTNKSSAPSSTPTISLTTLPKKPSLLKRIFNGTKKPKFDPRATVPKKNPKPPQQP